MKRRRLIFVLALLVVVAGVGSWLFGLWEPRYQGKSLSRWFVQYYTVYDAENDETGSARRAEAAAAIRAIGTNAVPFLLKECFSNEPDSAFRSNLLTSLRHLPAPFSFPSYVRVEYIRGAAAEALLEIRPPAEMILSKATNELAGTNRYPRYVALFLLGTIGPGAEKGVPWLVRGLQSSDPNEVVLSLRSIQNLGPAAQGALPELLGLLTNPPPTAWIQTDWLREHAAPALASLGTNAAPAIPILKQLFLAETNYHVRTIIASALCRIDPNETTALVTVFEEMTCTNTPQARVATARFLGNLGVSAINTAPLLFGMLTDTNLDVSCAAAGALRKMGAVKAAVKKPLAKQLTDQDEEIRFHAAKTLVQFDPADPDALNVFIEIIRKRSNQSAAAIQELGTLGPSARLAIPVLREASHSDDRYVRGSATWALSSIESTQGPQ
ncbi:MAG TPA: hypothetical protein VN794_00390 [Methylomirabilota bacterium]|nr:hypothetical protein [Methylomirabilota bacterium]